MSAATSRRHATVVAVVGAEPEKLAVLERAANVVLVVPEVKASPLARAAEAWRRSAAVAAPFAVHDADPLRPVAEAWVRRCEGTGPVGEFEAAAHEAVERVRAGEIGLPDYYLLSAPERLGPTLRHWFLGVLKDAAPARVAVGEDLVAGLRSLPAGRWWPPLDELLATAAASAPDLAGLGAHEEPHDLGGEGAPPPARHVLLGPEGHAPVGL